MENAKLLPQALDFEQAVLSALIVDSRVGPELFGLIKSADVFYKPEHQNIYKAANNLFVKGAPIDLLTVSQELKVLGLLEQTGGDFFLIKIAQVAASGANADYHSRILLQMYLKRKIIAFNANITGMAMNPDVDVFELLDRWQHEFDKVSDVLSTGRETISFAQSLDILKKSIQDLTNRDAREMVGVYTGSMQIDQHTGGYKPQELIVLAARPGMGKTSMVLKTCLENVSRDIPVGFISLEMSIHQLTARAVAVDTNFHMNQLLKDGFSKPEYFETFSNHSHRMSKYKLFVDDSGAGDIVDVVMCAKRWYRLHNIKLLVVDYLQLMSSRENKGNRENEIASISRRMKLLAKELNIPIILLSQLSRSVDTRGGSKRPVLSDLRESGAIEQDADIVQFIYRPGYYGLEIHPEEYQTKHAVQAAEKGSDTEIVFSKYRGGANDMFLLKWVGDKTKFYDLLDEKEFQKYTDWSELQHRPRAIGEKSETVFDKQ
tara:strand:+ start:9155 stop:10621 length:1467 start_codon:yes stop_codon:yes gene_type:complete